MLQPNAVDPDADRVVVGQGRPHDARPKCVDVEVLNHDDTLAGRIVDGRLYPANAPKSELSDAHERDLAHQSLLELRVRELSHEVARRRQIHRERHEQEQPDDEQKEPDEHAEGDATDSADERFRRQNDSPIPSEMAMGNPSISDGCASSSGVPGD